VSERAFTFGSLFAGIGGLDLGLERAGMECKWQVEIDPYATRVLEKHWPNVARFKDVRDFPPRPAIEHWSQHDGKGNNLWPKQYYGVDLICGGFPCQDISIAGDRGGIENTERSGLWSEFFRIVCALRPRYVLVENVAALLVPVVHKGRRVEPAPIGRVLGDLASRRFNAEWGVLSARNFGAIHLRKRVFIVAHLDEDGGQASGSSEASEGPADFNHSAAVDSNHRKERVQGLFTGSVHWFPEFSWCQDVRRVEDLRGRSDLPEPLLRRDRNGVPNLVDRLSCLGNAVIPAAAEWIGRRILEADAV
jgi:DNA (cytosine-5)-methyltransferase 1